MLQTREANMKQKHFNNQPNKPNPTKKINYRWSVVMPWITIISFEVVPCLQFSSLRHRQLDILMPAACTTSCAHAEHMRHCCALLVVVALAIASPCGFAFPLVRYVRIESSSDAVVLNEVAVYPCGSSANVAEGKSATGSAFGGSCSGTAASRAPSLVVDGATSCSGGYSDTFCSDAGNSWWQVDLGQDYDVCFVAVLLSTTGLGAQYLRFRNAANVQLTSVSLTGNYATLTTCGAISCTIATATCAACTNAMCGGQSTSAADNYPACDCTCNAAYTGAFCNQQLCTIAANCNNQASGVSGFTPSCTCACSTGWTGASCQTSTACTVAVDCNGNANSVNGNRPSCNCSCTSAWTGSACQTSNACTSAADCNNAASAVSGNRPSCTCTCQPAWTGSTCATSNVCTSLVDCNGNAATVAGNRPTCTCTCFAAWTGATCAVLNVCTDGVDCSGHSTAVSGNRPNCACTCAPEWTGTGCETSNVCTNSVDCNGRATAVSGNRPACSCTCPAAWIGASCEVSNVCTDATDCSGHSVAVSGNRPTCTCTCQSEWTGAACAASNVCTNAADCSGNAAAVTGNRPACTCTCVPEWTGTACGTSNVCTNVTDCSGRAVAVSGNRPACTCTCRVEWTGAACLTSNACTNGVDCNGRAASVSGYRPSCSCACVAEWAGSACEASNVCTNAADCHNNARVVSGNRPLCSCACVTGVSGQYCDYTHTNTRTASGSPSSSSSSSPSMSTDASVSVSGSASATLSAPSATRELSLSASRTATASASRTATDEPSRSASTTDTSAASETLSGSPTGTGTGTSSASISAPTWTLVPSGTGSVTGSASATPSPALSLTESRTVSSSPSHTSSVSVTDSIGSSSRSGTAAPSATRSASTSAEAGSCTLSASLSPSATGTTSRDGSRSSSRNVSGSTEATVSGRTWTRTASASLTGESPSLGATGSASPSMGLSATPSATASSARSESASASAASSGSVTSSGTASGGTASNERTTSGSTSATSSASVSASVSSKVTASVESASGTSTLSGPSLSPSETATRDVSGSGSLTLSFDGATASDSGSTTASASPTKPTAPMSASESRSLDGSSATSTRSVTATARLSSRSGTDESSLSDTWSISVSPFRSGSVPTTSATDSAGATRSTTLSSTMGTRTDDASDTSTKTDSRSASHDATRSRSASATTSASSTITVSLILSPSLGTMSLSTSGSVGTASEHRSSSASVTPTMSPSATREARSETAPDNTPTVSSSTTAVDSVSWTGTPRRWSVTHALSLSSTREGSRTGATMSWTATSSLSLSQSESASASGSPLASVSGTQSRTYTPSTTLTLTRWRSATASAAASRSGSKGTRTASVTGNSRSLTRLVLQALPFTVGVRPSAWLSDGVPLLIAPLGINATAGVIVDAFPVDADGLAPMSPYRAPIELTLSDVTLSVTALSTTVVGFPNGAAAALQLPCSAVGGARVNSFGAAAVVLAGSPQFLIGDVAIRYPTLGNVTFTRRIGLASAASPGEMSPFVWSIDAGGTLAVANGVPQSVVVRNSDATRAARVLGGGSLSGSDTIVPALSLADALLPAAMGSPTRSAPPIHATVSVPYQPLTPLLDGASANELNFSQTVEVWNCPWPLTTQAGAAGSSANETWVAFRQPWSRAIEASQRLAWRCTNGTAVVAATRHDPCTLRCAFPADIERRGPLSVQVSLMYAMEPSNTPVSVGSRVVWSAPRAIETSSVANAAEGRSGDESVVRVPRRGIQSMLGLVLLPRLRVWLRTNELPCRAVPMEALGIRVGAVRLSMAACPDVALRCDGAAVSGSTATLSSCGSTEPNTTACLLGRLSGASSPLAMNLTLAVTDTSDTFTAEKVIMVVVDAACNTSLLNATTPGAPLRDVQWSVAGCPTDAFPVTGRCGVTGGDSIVVTVWNASIPADDAVSSIAVVFPTDKSGTAIAAACTSVVAQSAVGDPAAVYSCVTPAVPSGAGSLSASLQLLSSDDEVIISLDGALTFSGALSCPLGVALGGGLVECSGNGVCQTATLSCDCYADASLGYFTGDACSHCVAGYYGADCSSRCPSGSAACLPCSGHGTCSDGVTGSGLCVCVSSAALGYWGGDDCNSCSAGYYGSLCTSICPSPTFSATSSPVSVLVSVCGGRGTCDDGVYGTGLCNCSAAYRGATCSACSAGFYGASCAACPSSDMSLGVCSGHGACSDGDEGSGVCSCAVGYAGQACNVSCAVAFGLTCGWGACSATGRCTCTALHVLVDPASPSGACSACEAGYWGPRCTLACPCVHGTCDVVSGACTCSSGYWGRLCAEVCPGGATSPCSLHGVCTPETGVCVCYSGAQRGYYTGAACEQCNASYASPQCNVACPLGVDPATGAAAVCSNRGTCFNGTCSGNCRSGYWGAACSYECPGGATNPCSGRGECDAASGNCACVYGAVGVACEGSCDGGFAAPCALHGLCTSTGACQCYGNVSAGYWAGTACTACASPYSGPNCTVACDTRTGTVRDGVCMCATGYVGAHCDVACPIGDATDTSTGEVCSGRGTCSISTLEAFCACDADYYGPACGSYCTVALCLSTTGLVNPQCNVSTGACECRQSSAGHFSGPTCADCAGGYWGSECSVACPCSGRGSCNRYTSACQCAAGVGSGFWAGSACDTCAAGYIGALCNVRNVELSMAASAAVSGSNPLFPLAGVALHDPDTEVVLVGSNPLAAFATRAWESNMTYLQSLSVTLPAVAAGVLNASHLWLRLLDNGTAALTGGVASYAFVNRELLAAGIHPRTLEVFTSSAAERRHRQPMATTSATAVTAAWTAVSESGRCVASVRYDASDSSNASIAVLCEASAVAGGGTVWWSDTLPTQQVQWLGFVPTDAEGQELLVVSWTSSALAAATLEWGLRVYLAPWESAASVSTNSTAIVLDGCDAQEGCGIVSHCLLVPRGQSGSERLLCAAETSLVTANNLVLFVVDLADGSAGATASVVVPDGDQVSASRSDVGFSMSLFAFRGPTTAMLCRTLFDGATDTLSLLSVYSLDRVQGDRPTVLAMAHNATTRTLWLSVGTSQAVSAVAVNLFAIRAVDPYVFDQHGGAVVTIQGYGFVRSPVPVCEFQAVNSSVNASAAAHPGPAASQAVFVNSTVMLCVSQEVSVTDGGECDPLQVNVWYDGRSTSTALVGSLRPLTATLLGAATAESGGLATGWYASETVVTLTGFGFVAGATRASCRLENATSGAAVAWWGASAVNTTMALCTQPTSSRASGPTSVLRYSHDNETFSNAVSYTVVGPYSRVTAEFVSPSGAALVSPTIVSAAEVALPAVELSSVDAFGSRLGVFDTGSANRQLTCAASHPLYASSTATLRFATSARVSLANGTAMLSSLVALAPTTDTSGGASTTTTSRFVYCYDMLEPLQTVVLTVAVVPGAPVALQLVTTVSGSGFASGVASEAVLPTIVVAAVDAVGNFASVATAPSLLPQQVVCTYTKTSPSSDGTTSATSQVVVAASNIDQASGHYSLESLRTQSVFGTFVQLAVRPGNVSMLGSALAANAISSVWVVLPQQPCESSALLAVVGTFACVQCPQPAACDGSDTMTIPSGYWRGSATSLSLYACDPASSCTTPLDCAAGYEGPTCGSCSEGYGRTVGSCERCTSAVPRVVAALVVVGVVAIVWALGLRDIAFTAVEDIASRLVETPESTKRGPLPIIVKLVVSHLQLLSLLPLSALETPWAVSTAEGSGEWSVVTPSFLNVACAVGRRAHNEMVAVVALFGLALAGCALAAVGLAWVADRAFRKNALKISIQRRAQEVRASGASPMKYRTADAMLTTSHFRRAVHRDRVLRNHRELLEVYIGDGEREVEVSHSSDARRLDSGRDDSDDDFLFMFGPASNRRPLSSPDKPLRRHSAWFDDDLDVDDLGVGDLVSPTFAEKYFPRMSLRPSTTSQSRLTLSIGSVGVLDVGEMHDASKSVCSVDTIKSVADHAVTVAYDVSSKSCALDDDAAQMQEKSVSSSTRSTSKPNAPTPQAVAQLPMFDDLVNASRLAQPNLRPPPIKTRVVNIMLVSLVVLAFLLYPTIVQAAQRVISCRTFITDSAASGDAEGTVRVLSYDPAVDCTSAGYHAWLPVAALVLVVVGAGFPLLCPAAVLVAQHATCAGNAVHARHLFHFTTGGYRVWYWEAIVLFRKAAVVVALVVVGQEREAFQSFSLACGWVFGASLALNVVMLPWQDALLGQLELLSLAVLCASSLALAVQSSTAPLPAAAVSIAFVAVNAAMLLFFVRAMVLAAKRQALELIKSEAPDVHDALSDRTGAIERLRLRCRATESVIRATHARYAACLEISRFLECHADMVHQASSAENTTISLPPREEMIASDGDNILDVEVDTTAIAAPTRRGTFEHSMFDDYDFSEFCAAPQQAHQAFDQLDMRPQSHSLSRRDDIDLWDVDIGFADVVDAPLPPARELPPWEPLDNDITVAVDEPLGSHVVTQLATAVPPQLHANSPERHPPILDAQMKKHQLESALEPQVRQHMQSFVALAAVLPRSVAAYEADIAARAQQLRSQGQTVLETSSSGSQLRAALCELLQAEKRLIMDVEAILCYKRSQ